MSNARRTSPTDLPPPARLHRSPPDHRVRCLAVSHSIENTTGWSIKKASSAPPALPHHRNPGRRPHHHRRRPLPEDPAKPSKRSPKPCPASPPPCPERITVPASP